MKKLAIISTLVLIFTGRLDAQDVRISTDREFYYQGENILVEAYSLGDAPQDITENLYLVNEAGKLVTSFQFLVRNGYGKAIIPTSPKMDDGYYQLSFKHHNELSRKGIYIGSDPKTPKYAFQDDVRIAPEGNKVTCGCITRFSVQSTAGDSLFIGDITGTLNTRLKTDELGYGSFVYSVPVDTNRISFEVVNGRDTTVVNLADLAGYTGYCIQTALNLEKQELEMSLSLNDSLKTGGSLTILVERGDQKIKEQVDLHSVRKRLVEIPLSMLNEGLWKLSVTDDQSGEIRYQRVIYVPDYSRGNVNVHLSKTAITPREKLNINIKKRFQGNVSGSLRVVNANFIDPSALYSRNILAQAILPSSLVDEIPDIGYYLNDGDHNGINTALLFYKGEVKRDIEQVKYERFASISLLLKDTTNRPDLISFFNPSTNVLFEVPVGTENRIDYTLYNRFIGSLKFYYQGYLEGRKVDMNMELDKQTPSFNSFKPVLGEMSALKLFRDIGRINQYYPSFLPAKIANINAEIPLDIERDLNDFYKFQTVEEAVMEVMPGLAMRTRRGKRVFRVFSDDDNKFIEGGDPLFIVNNYMTFDQEKIKKLDPKKFVRYGVAYSHSKRNLYGKLGKYGVVKLETTEILEGFEGEFIEITGVSTYEVGDKIAVSGNDDDSAPYFNPMVYHTSNIEFDGNAQYEQTLEMIHNDLLGDFYVIFEGVSEGGEPVFSVAKYTAQLENAAD